MTRYYYSTLDINFESNYTFSTRSARKKKIYILSSSRILKNKLEKSEKKANVNSLPVDNIR